MQVFINAILPSIPSAPCDRALTTRQVSLVATTVAHEMGHNFGMEHDTKACDCKDDKCIMSASSRSEARTGWGGESAAADGWEGGGVTERV